MAGEVVLVVLFREVNAVFAVVPAEQVAEASLVAELVDPYGGGVVRVKYFLEGYSLFRVFESERVMGAVIHFITLGSTIP